MTSDTHTRHGSRLARHGSARWCRAYHVRSRRCRLTRSASARAWTAASGGTADPGVGRMREHGEVSEREPDSVRADFVRLVQQPEPAIELARAALLVAAESDPRV